LQQSDYVLFSTVSAALSFAAALYIRRWRTAPAATSLFLMLLSTSIWSGGYAMELASADEEMKHFWLKIQYLGISFLPAWGILFSFQYTGKSKLLSAPAMAAVFLIPAATLILNWTNEWHGLFYREVTVNDSGGVAVLALTKGEWYWVHIAYVYGAYLLMASLLLQMFWRKGRLYRIRAFIIVLALLPPVVLNVLYLTRWTPLPDLDLAPFAFTATGVLIIYGLYRYQLFDVVPVARNVLIEYMSEGVIVLDTADRVIDINPAARDLVRTEPSSAMGKNIRTLLPAWKDVVSNALSWPEQTIQFKTLSKEGTARHMDLRIIPLTDKEGIERGKLLTLRDITFQKRQEREREELIRKLRHALSRVKMLSGLLPICANCKKIRDDRGYWHQVEVYIRENSEAKFSHGICPKCAEKHYPDMDLYGD